MIPSLEVSVSSEWADIHRNFAPLIRLSNIAAPLSKFTSVECDAGEVVAYNSSHCSPVKCNESSNIFELLAPVNIQLPPGPTSEELSNFNALVTNLIVQQENEKQYISLIFREYCKRKGIMQKREKEFDAFIEEFAELQRRDLPPFLRQALAILEEEETTVRGEIVVVYNRFLEWIEGVQPQWLEAVDRQIAENRMKEEAKKAALEASKALLVQELEAGRRFTSMSGNSIDSSYVPNVGLDDGIHEEPSPAALRRKAIELLEQQEAVMRHRRDQHLLELKLKEESLRQRIKNAENERLSGDNKEKANWELLHQDLPEQKNDLQLLHAHEAEMLQKEEKRRMMLEHCTAEEELIRHRLKNQEDKRRAVEEEKKCLEAQKKKEFYEHILAEEELLRQRMQQREAEKEMENQRQAAAIEQARQEKSQALRRKQEAFEEELRHREQHNSLVMEQEEVLRRVKKEYHNAERAKQVTLLKEQEEMVKARLRAKEIAEIQAKEQKLQNQAPQQIIYPSMGFLSSNSQAATNPSAVATTPYLPTAHAPAATSGLFQYVGPTSNMPPSTQFTAFQTSTVGSGGVAMHPVQTYPPYYTGHVPDGIQPMALPNPAVVYPNVNSWGGTGVPYAQPNTIPTEGYRYMIPYTVQLLNPQIQGGS
ncbi:unnamed protein product [Phytomonas sp. Hart1]|nr:unnamed protein product [Phytomonas sp. Hart1]|eukprot:CCW71063.1 unnamed protein product [Phytomonas sp. isolate Hart1]